jgi:hypothetical protein
VHRLMLLSFVAGGCSPGISEESGDDGRDLPAISETVDTSDTGGDTAPPIETDDPGVFDCAMAPDLPLPAVPVQGARAHNGLAFSHDGRLIGSDNQNLWAATSDGEAEVFSPNHGVVYQMLTLPSGDIVVEAGNLGQSIVVAPDGSWGVLSSAYGYGVTMGPDGMLYVVGWDRVYRVDPETGASQNWLTPSGNNSLRVIEFDMDLTRAYIGTTSGSGKLLTVELDANLDPVGDAEILVTGVGTWHDAVVQDACGNLYVADYGASRLYRITRDLQIDVVVQYTYTSYGHGAVWGTGEDGWDDLALYVPQPYNGNKVARIDLGIPSKHFTGTVLNAD